MSDEREQRIEAPNTDDVDRLARQLIAAEEIVYAATAQNLSGSQDDLEALQSTLDMGHLTANQTFELQCLGLAFVDLLELLQGLLERTAELAPKFH